MAQRTQVFVVDDLDGKELPEGQGQTVKFSLDGTSYEIDLSKKNADAFRKDVKRYTDAVPPQGWPFRYWPTQHRQPQGLVRCS